MKPTHDVINRYNSLGKKISKFSLFNLINEFCPNKRPFWKKTVIMESIVRLTFYQTSADSNVYALSLSRFCPYSPENPFRCLFAVRIFRCSPLPLCRAGQGRDITARTFGVLFRRRLPSIRIIFSLSSFEIFEKNEFLKRYLFN